MTEDRGELDMALRMEGAPMIDRLPVTTASLGENNNGSIGPDQLDDAYRSQLDHELGDPKYIYPVNPKMWSCVDGRTVWGRNPGQEYPGQIAGSLVQTEVAAEYMVNPDPAPQSQVFEEISKQAAEDEITIVVHGDTNKKEGGCAAAAYDRDILAYSAANVDIVAPLTIAVGNAVGLDLDDAGVSEDEVVELFVNGGKNAEKKELFDVTPAEKKDIQQMHGARYIEFATLHNEKKAVVGTDPEHTFNGTEFAKDHVDNDGENEQVFVVSAAAFVKVAFERDQKRGIDKKQTTLRCLAAIGYNIGVAKFLGNENLEAGLIGSK